MSVATDQQVARIDGAATDDDVQQLRGLQRRMLQQVCSAETQLELLYGLGTLVREYTDPVAMFYFPRNEQGELAEAIRLHPVESSNRSGRFAKLLTAPCQAACRAGELQVRNQAAPERVLIAAPIVQRGRDPEALGFIFPANDSPRHLIMLVQMITSHLVLWQAVSTSSRSERDAQDTAAVVELLDQMARAPSLHHACYTLAGELQSHLPCHRVAIGLRRRGQGSCRLVAISGVAQFDHRSQTARAMEATLDEAVLRDDVTTWPSPQDEQEYGALAHKHLCSREDMKAAVSTPLRDQDGTAIGAIIVLAESAASLGGVERFLRAAERPFATSLLVMEKLEGGPLARFGRVAGQLWQTWKGKAALAAVTVVLAAMACPWPYNIRCDCRIEPATRRFVAAPFEGTLEKSLAKPGQMVSPGDVLARMDGREIRWQRASLVADQNQAVKKRDAAQVAGRYADAQIAKLEIERLNLELQLLDYRAENLEIKSAVAGIVTSGDLERAEGAPLTIGQTLFEIAPLEEMIIEVAVSDDEVSYIHQGQPIKVRLDAYPGETWRAAVEKVQPRSEIRDENNVFIAEAELANTDGRLRPGMKGRAKVVTERRAIGWILFHKPWEYLTKRLNW